VYAYVVHHRAAIVSDSWLSCLLYIAKEDVTFEHLSNAYSDL